MPFCESVIWESEGQTNSPCFRSDIHELMVALMPSSCWDLLSLPQDYCPPMVSSLCWWLWGRFAARVCTVLHSPQCGEIICVSMRGRKFRCRRSSLSPMESPLPSPAPAPWLRIMPWDTAKDHADMNPNCSSNLILAVPLLLYISAGSLDFNPGVACVFHLLDKNICCCH